MASRETDKPLPLSAMLGSKDELPVAMMRFFPVTDFYLDIEVEDFLNVKRPQYSVSLYVAENNVVKSMKAKPRSSVVKWEWRPNHQM
jgi:hypothetical protein